MFSDKVVKLLRHRVGYLTRLSLNAARVASKPHLFAANIDYVVQMSDWEARQRRGRVRVPFGGAASAARGQRGKRIVRNEICYLKMF